MWNYVQCLCTGVQGMTVLARAGSNLTDRPIFSPIFMRPGQPIRQTDQRYSERYTSRTEVEDLLNMDIRQVLKLGLWDTTQGPHSSNLVGNHNVRDPPTALLLSNFASLQTWKLPNFQKKRLLRWQHAQHSWNITALHQTTDLHPNAKHEAHIMLSRIHSMR
jgi:hypothetical protein